MENFILTKIFILTAISFIIAMAWTPLLTNFLYKHRLGKQIRNTGETPIFTALHQDKAGTPTMGGLLIWVTVLFIILLVYLLSLIWPAGIFGKLNFLTRQETLLPLGVLVASALVGLLDDIIDVASQGKGGFKIRHRLAIYTFIALVGAWWFYFKLDWNTLYVPFLGMVNIGWWYVPFFIFVIVATAFSVNEIDGLDGLAGGTLLAAFSVFAAIAFVQGRYNLVTFCGVIMGALLAFLWFNIHPARFFMGDTGAMSLGVTLGVVALLTNTALLLPVVGLLFLIESLSVIVQLFSKKFRGKKIFLSTPIHHHFQAIGWPETKVVMRFWVIAGVMAVVGFVVYLADKGL